MITKYMLLGVLGYLIRGSAYGGEFGGRHAVGLASHRIDRRIASRVASPPRHCEEPLNRDHIDMQSILGQKCLLQLAGPESLGMLLHPS